MNAYLNGEEIPADWTGTISTDSVLLTDVNEAVAAEGTAEAIEEAKAKLVSGELQVFDISTFTVGGETLESHMADVDTDPDYEPDTEAVEKRRLSWSPSSAPLLTSTSR